MGHHARLVIWNDRSQPLLVWIEPWGGDYTVLPEQKLLITAVDSETKRQPHFCVVENDRWSAVYVEECDSHPDVLLDGKPVEAGCNRQASIDAGLYPDEP